MASEFRNLLLALAGSARDFVREGHRSFAARWPHGQVDGSPAAVGEELDLMGEWMKIRRPMLAAAPMSDPLYRELLKDPFSYHRAEGTQRGLIRAVEALGYTQVEYLDWFELSGAVTNQNAFGLKAADFPMGIWNWGEPYPPGLAGRRLRVLVETILSFKRASARLWELRTVESFVVTQSWWDGGQVGDPGYVTTQSGGPTDYVVVEGGAP